MPLFEMAAAAEAAIKDDGYTLLKLLDAATNAAVAPTLLFIV